MTKAREAGITLSVIALGTERDCDAEMLKDLARIGGGQCYFTEDVMDLPRLFAQDTFVIARSTFVEEETPIRIMGGLATLTSQTFSNPLPVGGYNLCYIQHDSTMSIRSEDEYHAPIIASRNASLGRVLCYTGQVDGKFTGAISEWESYVPLLASIGRWTAGLGEPLPYNMLATQEIQDGSLVIRLFLDPEREESSLETMPMITILRQTANGVVTSEQVQLQFEETEMLQATVPLSGSETLQATLSVAAAGQTYVYSLPPACLPYSPEFRPATPDRGKATLFEMAEATGGKERIELTSLWQDIPRVPRYFDLTPYLLYAASLLFLAEIFERRTGLMSNILRRITPKFKRNKRTVTRQTINTLPEVRDNSKEITWWEKRKRIKARNKTSTTVTTASTTEKANEQEPEKPQEQNAMLDALQKARLRAKKRRGE
jgi:hypothetical protein